jgi:outer membrane lipoprotein LolB
VTARGSHRVQRARAVARIGVTALACAALLVVAGCAGLSRVETGDKPLSDAAFHVAGRLSAHHGSDALAGNFDWRHAPGTDAITLATPLGQTLASLDRSGDNVTLRLADGHVLESPSFEALTTDAFGVPLPVTGLSAWIRGGGHAGSAFSIERDAVGRPSVLRQDGWEIVYAYAADGDTHARRLTLAYPGVDVRIVVDRRE